MNKLLPINTLLAALLACGNAIARDDQRMYPLEEALQTQAAKDKIDPSIRLYFGGQMYPAVVKELGEWQTNKKTNGVNKSDRQACEWTFLSAVLELQARTRKEGGNAVVGIKSNYNNIERSSETEYMCGSGALMSGVAFKGRVVKLSE